MTTDAVNRQDAWETIGYVPSSSSDREYKIQVNCVTGNRSCSCPSWRFSGGSIDERSCKHLRQFDRGHGRRV